MKILVVEDDELLQEGIFVALNEENYSCDCVGSVLQMFQYLNAGLYSLIILDIGLPDSSGLDALVKLRTQSINIPVLLLTARDSLEDKVIGLDAGADDYLIKPFELTELFARIRALLRRSEGKGSNIIIHQDFTLDINSQCLFKQNVQIELTMREYMVFHRLILRAGEVVSREILLNDMYSWNDALGSNTLEVYIHSLRSKLGKDTIQTIRGQGYKLI